MGFVSREQCTPQVGAKLTEAKPDRPINMDNDFRFGIGRERRNLGWKSRAQYLRCYRSDK